MEPTRESGTTNLPAWVSRRRPIHSENRGGEPPAHQAMAQQVLGPGEPAGQRPLGDAEPLSGRAPGQTVQLAENQGTAVSLR